MLLSEVKDAPLICVQSETIYSGTPFINEVVNNNATEGCEIHWFCYDLCARDLRSELCIENGSIHFHDCFPKNLNFQEPRQNEVLEFLSQKNTAFLPNKIIIIIDSFSTLLLSENESTVNNLLHQIYSKSTINGGKTVLQTLLTIHANSFLNTSTAFKHLKYLTKVWIKIDPKVATMRMKKSSGKLITKAYEYTINERGKMNLSKKPITTEKPKDQESTEESTSIVSTFKLDLTDQERKARDAVQLPYIRSNNNEKEVSGSVIHYHPDEYDDWDEEDPDNDLEFV